MLISAVILDWRDAGTDPRGPATIGIFDSSKTDEILLALYSIALYRQPASWLSDYFFYRLFLSGIFSVGPGDFNQRRSSTVICFRTCPGRHIFYMDRDAQWSCPVRWN